MHLRSYSKFLPEINKFHDASYEHFKSENKNKKYWPPLKS